MSLATGPYTLTGGQTITISLPAGTVQPCRGVIVVNTTLAAVVVTVTASTRVVLPGSADFFPCKSGAPGVTVRSLGSSGQGGTIHTTWVTPAEIPKGGYPLSASRTSYTTVTTQITTVHVIPVVKTVGVFTGRVALAGTTTQVPIIPATRTSAYWENLRIGWSIWSTGANTGTWIYIGDSAGGTPTGWARIPSGVGKLYGKFTINWGNAWVARVSGKTGDHVNVWAA